MTGYTLISNFLNRTIVSDIPECLGKMGGCLVDLDSHICSTIAVCVLCFYS